MQNHGLHQQDSASGGTKLYYLESLVITTKVLTI